MPKDNPANITSVKDLANNGVKFVTAQQGVPIGQYTSAMLDKAAADPAYGADFPKQVEGNIVSREDNVRQIVSKVQLGEADAGVVYTTDVTPQVRDQLQQIAIPDPLQTIATYPIAVAKGSNAAGGEAFTQFVLGPQGQAILGKWGFLTLPVNAPRRAAATNRTGGPPRPRSPPRGRRSSRTCALMVSLPTPRRSRARISWHYRKKPSR